MKLIKAACPLQPAPTPLLHSAPGTKPWAGHSSSEVSSGWHWAQSCPPLKTSPLGKWGRAGRLSLATSEPIQWPPFCLLVFKVRNVFYLALYGKGVRLLGSIFPNIFSKGLIMKVKRGLKKGEASRAKLGNQELLSIEKRDTAMHAMYSRMHTLLKAAFILHLLRHLHASLGYIGYLNATYWARMASAHWEGSFVLCLYF